MPYLDIEKIMAENDISVLQENEYLLSRGKEFIVKSIKKWNTNISMVEVELTQATKYLEDTGDSELSNDDKEALEDAMTRLEEKRKNGTASSEVRKRLHNIWQMESEYFNEIRKWQIFYLKLVILLVFILWILYYKVSICDEEICRIFLLNFLLIKYQGAKNVYCFNKTIQTNPPRRPNRQER